MKSVVPPGLYEWLWLHPTFKLPGSCAVVVTLRSTVVVMSPRLVRRYSTRAIGTAFSVVVRVTVFAKP